MEGGDWGWGRYGYILGGVQSVCPARTETTFESRGSYLACQRLYLFPEGLGARPIWDHGVSNRINSSTDVELPCPPLN